MRTLLFILLVAVQLAIPLAMIAKYEAVLAFGREYKFRCAPADPIDYLRGRYVALNFSLSLPHEDSYDSKEKYTWAALETDADGFAKVARTSDSRPASGDALKYSIKWGRAELPFNKYFMNENLAPQAEQAYRDATRTPSGADAKNWSPNCYLTVKIWHGLAVPEKLIIDGKPVEELLRAKKGK